MLTDTGKTFLKLLCLGVFFVGLLLWGMYYVDTWEAEMHAQEEPEPAIPEYKIPKTPPLFDFNQEAFDGRMNELDRQREELRLQEKFETERQAQERLHAKYPGKLEHRLWDGTRVDILTDEYAIEIDFAPKWAEAIGQAKYYAYVTGKKPAVILLIKDMKREGDYVYRLQTVCVADGIQWYLEPVLPRPDPDDGAAARPQGDRTDEVGGRVSPTVRPFRRSAFDLFSQGGVPPSQLWRTTDDGPQRQAGAPRDLPRSYELGPAGNDR